MWGFWAPVGLWGGEGDANVVFEGAKLLQCGVLSVLWVMWVVWVVWV